MKALIFLSLCHFSLISFAQGILPLSKLDPSDIHFYEFQGGSYLDFFTDGSQNEIIYGTGDEFTAMEREQYQKILNGDTNQEVYEWVLRDLDTSTILKQSRRPDRQFYGASVSKVFVAGAYLNHVKGRPTSTGIKHLNDMIIISSNTSWSALQVLLGAGDENFGRYRVDKFLKSLGITRSIGYRGNLGAVHGNEVNALDISQFIQLSYNASYPGSKHLFQTMFLSRTGKLRAKKYLPSSMVVGGKTGTYDGETILNGVPFKSQSKHQTIVFEYSGKFYSLTVLSDPGSDESIAVLCGGLIRDVLVVE